MINTNAEVESEAREAATRGSQMATADDRANDGLAEPVHMMTDIQTDEEMRPVSNASQSTAEQTIRESRPICLDDEVTVCRRMFTRGGEITIPRCRKILEDTVSYSHPR